MDPYYFPVDMTDLEATITFHEFQKVIADRKSRVDCVAASEGTTLTV